MYQAYSAECSRNMKRTDYKKGDVVDAISIAGEDFYTLEAYSIKADIFDKDNGCHIPLINSDGNGNFFKFMNDLKNELNGKPIIFECVINPKLQRVLKRFGFHET